MMQDEIQAWKNRIRRKGPFYLYSSEPYHYELLRSDGVRIVQDGTQYTVIWRDKNKVRIGTLRDWMSCRYGIATRANLLGDRPQDMWRGHLVDDAEFEAMRAVRNGVSSLPEFDLDNLRNLSW
jgi:hypothetical protein